MMNSIFDYLEDIYCANGIKAQLAESEKMWEMYTNDEEVFRAYCEEKGIDLEARTIDCCEDDLTLWIDEH